MTVCYDKVKAYKAQGWIYGSSFTTSSLADVSVAAHKREGKDSFKFKCTDADGTFWYVMYREEGYVEPEPEPEPEPLPVPTCTGEVRDAVSFARLGSVRVVVGDKTTFTDSQGNFSIEVPRQMSIAITLDKEGYETYTDGLETPETGTIKLVPKMRPLIRPLPKIIGKVVDSVSGEGIDMAEITNGILTALAQSDGTYEIEVAPLTAVTLVCSFVGYHSKSVTVSTPETGTKTVNFALRLLEVPEPEPEPEPEPPRTWFEKMVEEAKGSVKDLLMWVGTTELRLIKDAITLFTGKEYEEVDIAESLKIIWSNWPLVNSILVLTEGRNVKGEVQTELGVKDYLDIGLTLVTLGAATQVKFLGQLVTKVGRPKATKVAADIYGNLITAGEVTKAHKFATAAFATKGSSTLLSWRTMAAAGLLGLPVLMLWWYHDNLPFYGYMAKEAGLLPADITTKITGHSIEFSRAYDGLVYAKTGEAAEIHHTEAQEILDAWREDVEAYKGIEPNFWQKEYQLITGETFISQYDYYMTQIDRAQTLLDTVWAEKKAEFGITLMVTVTFNIVPLADVAQVNGIDLKYEYGKYTGTFEPGVLKVHITKEGYIPIDDEFTRGEGEQVTASYELRKLEKRASVEIVTVPGYVDVYIDDKFIDTTDALGKTSFLWDAGTYQFKFHRDGWHDEVVPVDLYEDKTKRMDLALDEIIIKPTEGVLVVNTDPGGVDIYIAGEKIGATDETGLLMLEIAPFTGDVTFIKDGYYTRTKSVSIWAGRSTSISVTLTKEPIDRWLWKLDISAADEAGNPLHPKILINGSFTDKWAPDYVLLEPGTYTVMLELSGYAPWTQHILLEEISG